MKGIISICLAVTLCLILTSPASASMEKQTVVLAVNSKLATINGETCFLETPPFITGGATLVPLRFISTAFSAQVSWDPVTKTANITKENMKIKITPGHPQVEVQHRTVQVDQPAQVQNGTTFIPLRFVSNALGATIEWNSLNQTITILVI